MARASRWCSGRPTPERERAIDALIRSFPCATHSLLSMPERPARRDQISPSLRRLAMFAQHPSLISHPSRRSSVMRFDWMVTFMATYDVLFFLRALAFNPRRVGAIAPSGANLASLITSEISRDSGPVLELGPGTGVFTQALLARGVKEQDLTLVEYGSDFVRRLQTRFPRARPPGAPLCRSFAARCPGAARCGRRLRRGVTLAGGRPNHHPS